MAVPIEKTVRTTCSYCGVGCGVVVGRDRLGRLHLRGDEAHLVNRGMLCSKGRALHHVVQDQSDRLLYPQMRRSRAHPLERVTWDTALDRVAATFKAIIQRHGPEAVGLYVSGQCLTEEYYVANKLMKGFIGCNNIDTNSRLCMSSAVAAYKLALGDDLCPLSYEDIELCDTFLIAGANPAFCHPILFRRLERHKEKNPSTKVVVVDPRRTQSCSLADLHLQINPGTDVMLYNAIARVLIERHWLDDFFVHAHTEDFEAARAAAMSHSVEAAAAICDIHVEDIHTAAQWIGKARAFQSWWAMGLNQSSTGVDKNLALINLSLLTGQIGRPGAGPFSLTGQPNAMGGREVGGLANMLAAHRDLANATHREEVAAHWNSGPISAKPGLTATEMFDALADGRMRAIWVICTNPAVSLPQGKKVDAALKHAPFVVVQDISNNSDTVAYADIVLPAAGWAEKEGTMTNSERRVSLVQKLLDPPGETLPDVEILCRFASKMGWGENFRYRAPEEIFNEHRALTRGTAIDISGVSYARLRDQGSVQWPCPDAAHAGTPRLFTNGRFATSSGRARLHGITYTAPAEPADATFPLVLTTGRVRDQWHTMTRTGKVSKLRAQVQQPYVEVHPADALVAGVEDGARVRIISRNGEIIAAARITNDIKRGVAFVPMHWTHRMNGEGVCVNAVTSARVDSRSKEPDFKFSAIRIEKLTRSPRKIIVIGAGAAALQFITSYRERNRDDTIDVFSGESDGFYNRVQLPHYVSGEQKWESLVTCDNAALARLDVTLHKSTRVTRIDRACKSIIDQHERSHHYDVLLLATGSSPALPPGERSHVPGAHVLRTRADADGITTAARPAARATIVGGGLLGIELAGALVERGMHVTLLHRSSRLMSAQLDEPASEMLREDLEQRGIQVLLRDAIDQLHIDECIRGLRTKSGRYIPCDLLAYAIGTKANDQLARECGLHCGDGVVVDDALRSNDPCIYALGEVAEHHGRRHGTTLAAQQQAEVVAANISGDGSMRYAGTMAMHILKLSGLQLATLQAPDEPPPGAMIEEICIQDRAEHLYLKCRVYQNRLISSLLFGDTSMLPHYRNWIENRIELDEQRRTLLRPGAATQQTPAKGRIVCSCMQVGVGNIQEAMRAGCGDLTAIGAATRAGSGCGSCLPELQRILNTAEEAA